MGFFSWECKGCGHPMLSEHATNHINGWMEQVVEIRKDGSELVGHYDGYGVIKTLIWPEPPPRITSSGEARLWAIARWRLENKPDPTDVQVESSEPCLWHYACWHLAGEPHVYSPSKMADDQGYFFGDGDHDLPDPFGHAT